MKDLQQSSVSATMPKKKGLDYLVIHIFYYSQSPIWVCPCKTLTSSLINNADLTFVGILRKKKGQIYYLLGL